MSEKLTGEQLESLGFKKNRRMDTWTVANHDDSVRIYCDCCFHGMWNIIVFDHGVTYRVMHDPVTIRDMAVLLNRFRINDGSDWGVPR